ncbi:hypothetical protein BCR43DRAFT_223325 [Syncephalastrum racemosum]|uniref:Zinc finger double-stranded RNA binding domain-containing protein n=1 Tax=Syncephalastrum racemosum TaxID=13706 RepID=A0A1X2HJH8_SYNRA|nr:hypothetical protein BCR43DRAFT_223325 [Syncephalastrum racemosum]
MPWKSTFHVSRLVNVNTKIHSSLILILLANKQPPGETIVSRINGRFTCPVCRKNSKNARTFNTHLKGHKLSGTSIYDSPPSNSTNVVPALISEDEGSPSATQVIADSNNVGANVSSSDDSGDDKPAMIRPDASINIMRNACLGRRIGCGEVKPQAQALNHHLVALDLVRIAHLAKIASDRHKARATLYRPCRPSKMTSTRLWLPRTKDLGRSTTGQ